MIYVLFTQADLTGLMYASFHNHPEVATALIEAGCELNSVGTVSFSIFLTCYIFFYDLNSSYTSMFSSGSFTIAPKKLDVTQGR